ncbi:hypothetical protein EDD11_010318 [Mortierella claussenii]|nr:hypothetical protein EDD11_010318 [Mortierella claussenii]
MAADITTNATTAVPLPPSLTVSSPPSSSAPDSLLPSPTLASSPAASTTVSPSNSTTSSLSSTSASASDSTEFRKTEAPPKQRSKNGYIGRVGFDTLDCEDTTQYAFTLQARTDHWKRTKRSRTFLVGTDLNDYSAHALKWVMENMVEDGDEIVALRVVPMELRDSFAKSGIPSFQGQEIAARSEATKIMDMIRESNKSKEINIIVECLVGNVRDTIQHMIKMYEPAMLVVGTRGRNSMKGFLLGSVSRYCLNHSPIPVTVVRPASKLIKSKTKAKGIFRRRTSAVQLDPSEQDEDMQPQLFYSSPLSRQTSRTSLDPNDAHLATAATMAELERKDSRSPESQHYHLHHRHVPTAAEKASAAKRSSIFSATSQPALTPPSPAASIHSSLNYASALLSSSPPNSSKPPPPPEGMIKLTKSVTTDGTLGSHWSSGLGGGKDKEKKLSSRKSFAKLSGSILLGPLSLGGSKKKVSAPS